jgi:hypothetical protein
MPPKPKIGVFPVKFREKRESDDGDRFRRTVSATKQDQSDGKTRDFSRLQRPQVDP